MKRVSQTLKVVLALFVAVFANGTLPTLTAYAAQAPSTDTSLETDSSTITDGSEQTPPAEESSDDTPAVPVAKLAAPQQESVYTPPACQVGDIYVVSKNANLTTATVKMSNSAVMQHKTCVVSLNSYDTDGPTWQTSGNQVFLDHDQVTLTMQHPQASLSVKSPKCYGQTDLYVGSTKYDGVDGPLPHYPQPVVPQNLIAYWNGGQKCEVPKKVTICHRTASASNPYVSITVDQSAVDGNTGNDNGKGDHYAEHKGPIFPATGVDGKWGDIIPPTAGHNGLNWTTEGQAILNNDCNVPVKVTVTPGRCAYGDVKSTLTVNVTGTAKDAQLVVYNSSNAVVYSVDIVVNQDGEVTSPTFPVVVSNLPAGDYTAKVIGKGNKVLASTTTKIDSCPTITPCEVITDQPMVTNDLFANYSGFGIVGGQDTRSKGHYNFESDGLHIWTEDTSSQSKVAWYHSLNVDLSAIGEPAMDYTATTGITPGLQLVLDFNNDGTPDGILVGESVYGNNWWLTNSSDAYVKAGAPHNGGGNGSQWYGTLNEWLAAFPSAKVKAVGFSLGSGVLASGVLHSLTFGCMKWEFGVKDVSPEAPIMLDYCYDDRDIIYIPYQEGVVYTINGLEVSGYYYLNGASSATVKAEPAKGYQFESEVQTEWTFNFTNESCLNITKTGKILEDTNKDGIASIGDLVTWEITVTNNGSSDLYEAFYVEVDDPGATVENDGYIGYLASGASVTLKATKALTVEDLQACKVTNTASFMAWRANSEVERTNPMFYMQDDETPFTGSVTAEFNIACPTPGSGGGQPQTPAVLPATGENPVGNPLFTIAAAMIAYGATFFLQKRRDLATESSK